MDKLDTAQNKFTAQVHGVAQQHKWWTAEPPVCLGSMAWHRPHKPWSIEVKKQAACMCAKMAKTAAKGSQSMAATLLRNQTEKGHRDPFIELGRSTCERWNLPHRMPARVGALKRWKKRMEAGAQSDLHAYQQEYLQNTTNLRPSDTMMRLTLTQRGDEASLWRTHEVCRKHRWQHTSHGGG